MKAHQEEIIKECPSTHTKMVASILKRYWIFSLILLLAVIIGAAFFGMLLFTDNDKSDSIRLDNIYKSSQGLIEDGWIYYINPLDKGRLNKIRLDGSDLQRVTESPVGEIIKVDEWIYYDNLDEKSNLYRIKADGSSKQKLTDFTCYQFKVYKDWIYFSNRSDNFKLYRMKTDGTELMKLSDSHPTFFDIVGDSIYFSDYSEDGRLQKIKINGSDGKELNDKDSNNIKALKDWIFYQQTDESLITNHAVNSWIYRINHKNGSNIRISDESSISRYWFTKDRIYFLRGKDSKLVSVNLDGSNKIVNSREDLNAWNLRILNESEGWLYYLLERDGIYRMRPDGSDNSQLCQVHATAMCISGEWIYFEDNGNILKRMKKDGSNKEELINVEKQKLVNSRNSPETSSSDGNPLFKAGAQNFMVYSDPSIQNPLFTILSLDGRDKIEVKGVKYKEGFRIVESIRSELQNREWRFVESTHMNSNPEDKTIQEKPDEKIKAWGNGDYEVFEILDPDVCSFTLENKSEKYIVPIYNVGKCRFVAYYMKYFDSHQEYHQLYAFNKKGEKVWQLYSDTYWGRK
ncbi:MAG: DUF5050 domain-containing protein [Clostridia bacterium]|nr:DUF5050 domain-containing protein [Clostridia bacterium]